ncbi:hypothetical protein ACQW5G_07000 [Fructilactobacillus sp. Tb1]|uniref:hypothetical protein n=1 Tax=Fructilactobacillus sp. Tb1 TaxID=3422304 RepID=UPI003D2A6188
MNTIETVALEWLKNQDLSDKTPVETYTMFEIAVKEIQNIDNNPRTQTYND